MLIEISSEKLRAELSLLRSIAEKGKQPALQNVLMVTSDRISNDGVLRMIVTDLNHTLQCDVAARILQPGSLCVHARRLFDIASVMPTGKDLSIKGEENGWAQISCQSSHFKVSGISPQNFPEVSQLNADATRTTINAERLRTMIHRTIFAITTENGRYALQGALLSLNQQRDRMVATDGHRLAVIEGNGMSRSSLNNEISTLVTHKTLMELLKLTQGMKAEIEFAADSQSVLFNLGKRQLIARQLNGQFPDWEKVLPDQYQSSAVVMVGTLNESLRRVALMSEGRTGSVNFHFSKGELTLSAIHTEAGQAHETLPIEQYEGEDLDVNLNYNYVTDILNALSSGDVIEIQLNGSQSPVVIRPIGETSVNYKTVTMPLR